MSDSGPDQQAAATEPEGVEPLTPAALAARVATVVGDNSTISVGALPMWDRLDTRPRRTRCSRLALGAAWGVTLGLLALVAFAGGLAFYAHALHARHHGQSDRP